MSPKSSVDKRKRMRQLPKATNFSPEELLVLFTELAARFDGYFPLRSPQTNAAPSRLQICGEIAAIITRKCGFERKDKQVLERIRLEINRLKGRLELEKAVQTDASLSYKLHPLPLYLVEIEPLFRQYNQLDERASSSCQINDSIDRYRHFNTFHEGSISVLDLFDGGSSTSFSSPISFEEELSNKRVQITTPNSFAKTFNSEKDVCSSCVSEETRDRMRICTTCLINLGVEINESNFEELLLRAYCANCAMDGHVDKGHRTEKIANYDKQYQVCQEINAKVSMLKDEITMIKGEYFEAFDAIQQFDQIMKLPFDDKHPCFQNSSKFLEYLDELTTMLKMKNEIDKKIQVFWQEFQHQLQDLKPSPNLNKL
ncbi:unnamed protein product, partial [Mesorhabditis belari]|uniref:Uncharacterized protein n=1 Tax=Mesorhabditis belari TaxID=2138241 RepID=A0AAF3E976_9BILA